MGAAMYVREELSEDAQNVLLRDALARERAERRMRALEARFADAADAVAAAGAPPRWVARAVRATCCGGHAFSAVASELGWRGVLETQCDIGAVEALVDALTREAEEERHNDAFYGDHVVDLAEHDVCDIFAALGLWVFSAWTRAVSPQLRADIVAATENSVDRVACLRSALRRLGATQFEVLVTIVTRMTTRALAGIASTGSLSRRINSANGGASSASNSFAHHSPLLVNMFDRAMAINAAVFGPLLFAHSDDELDPCSSDQQTPSPHTSQHGIALHGPAAELHRRFANERESDEDVLGIDGGEEDEIEGGCELEDVVDVIRAENAFCVLINLWPDVCDVVDEMKRGDVESKHDDSDLEEQMDASDSEEAAQGSTSLRSNCTESASAHSPQLGSSASDVAVLRDQLRSLERELGDLKLEVARLREDQGVRIREVSETCAFWIEMVLAEIHQSSATSQSSWLSIQRRMAQIEKGHKPVLQTMVAPEGASTSMFGESRRLEERRDGGAGSALQDPTHFASSGGGVYDEVLAVEREASEISREQRQLPTDHGAVEAASQSRREESGSAFSFGEPDGLCEMFRKLVSAHIDGAVEGAQGASTVGEQSDPSSALNLSQTIPTRKTPQRYFRDGRWMFD